MANLQNYEANYSETFRMDDSNVVRANNTITITTNAFQLPYTSLVGIYGRINGVDFTNDESDNDKTLYTEGANYTIKKLNNNDDDPVVSKMVLTLINTTAADSDTITFFIKPTGIVPEDLQYKKQLVQKQIQGFTEGVQANLAAENEKTKRDISEASDDTYDRAIAYANQQDDVHDASIRAYARQQDADRKKETLDEAFIRARDTANHLDSLRSTAANAYADTKAQEAEDYADTRDNLLAGVLRGETDAKDTALRLLLEAFVNRRDLNYFGQSKTYTNTEINKVKTLINNIQTGLIGHSIDANGNLILNFADGTSETINLSSLLSDEIAAIELRLDAIEAKNTEQDGRLDAIETKNVEQDNSIADIERINNGQGISIRNAEQKIDLLVLENNKIDGFVRVVRKEGTSISDKDYFVENEAELIQRREFYIVNPQLGETIDGTLITGDIAVENKGKYANQDGGIITYTDPKDGDTAFIYADRGVDITDGDGNVSHENESRIIAVLVHEGGQWIITNSYFKNANNCIESGAFANAEGEGTIASEYAAHAEGRNTTASGKYAHAEGTWHAQSNRRNVASGEASHTEGVGNEASGRGSHAEGWLNIASETAAHAEGRLNEAAARYSHAEGFGNKVKVENAHVQGKNAVLADEDTLFGIGNGDNFPTEDERNGNENVGLIYEVDKFGNSKQSGECRAQRFVLTDGTVIDGSGSGSGSTNLDDYSNTAETKEFIEDAFTTEESWLKYFDYWGIGAGDTLANAIKTNIDGAGVPTLENGATFANGDFTLTADTGGNYSSFTVPSAVATKMTAVDEYIVGMNVYDTFASSHSIFFGNFDNAYGTLFESSPSDESRLSFASSISTSQGQRQFISNTGVITANAWSGIGVHIRRNKTITGYANGEEALTVTMQYATDSIFDSANNKFFGSSASGNDFDRSARQTFLLIPNAAYASLSANEKESAMALAAKWASKNDASKELTRKVEIEETIKFVDDVKVKNGKIVLGLTDDTELSSAQFLPSPANQAHARVMVTAARNAASEINLTATTSADVTGTINALSASAIASEKIHAQALRDGTIGEAKLDAATQNKLNTAARDGEGAIDSLVYDMKWTAQAKTFDAETIPVSPANVGLSFSIRYARFIFPNNLNKTDVNALVLNRRFAIQFASGVNISFTPTAYSRALVLSGHVAHEYEATFERSGAVTADERVTLYRANEDDLVRIAQNTADISAINAKVLSETRKDIYISPAHATGTDRGFVAIRAGNTPDLGVGFSQPLGPPNSKDIEYGAVNIAITYADWNKCHKVSVSTSHATSVMLNSESFLYKDDITARATESQIASGDGRNSARVRLYENQNELGTRSTTTHRLEIEGIIGRVYIGRVRLVNLELA